MLMYAHLYTTVDQISDSVIRRNPTYVLVLET